ncbi:MAG: nicotinate-nucleotide--dimethylbenzimidazole phosphoribosyltransferase [Rhodobacterales bacterium]|nr:MAG: nicotinate-nucleotide--dimethylbenzimidazole phosphoribosyltransferase [Rhodobacterales bacterium]
MQFDTISGVEAAMAALPEADAGAMAAAEARNAVLTKPAGALGRLEEVALWYASWRGEAAPQVRAPQVIVFAGNHGVAARGVSAFPPEVTVQMVANFEAGGAAINQLSAEFGTAMSVVPLELDRPTADFTQGPAMSEAELMAAMQAGWDAVDPASDLLVVGEMGIGNTTSAAAICTALFEGAATDWTGRGTGVEAEALAAKAQVVAEGVRANAGAASGLAVLAALGGRELAAMAGAMLRARFERIPVVLDGFICCAAAACLQRVNARALDHAVAGHVSAEGAHANLLKELGKEPLLSLGLRLGEGSGAGVALGVVKAALACHSGMATFAEAGVADG